MSIATLSTRIHNLTPADELTGSLTRERVGLMVRYAACHVSQEVSWAAGLRWLAYVLDTHIPADPYDGTVVTAVDAMHVEDADLEHWWDIENTPENREAMQAAADGTLTANVEWLTGILCAQLGV